MKKNWEKIKVGGVVEENEDEIRDDDDDEEKKEEGVNFTIFVSSLELYSSQTMHIEYYLHETEGSPGQ